ncbi:VfmB protein [Dickeya undicola]|uniref:VfmB protein n=1 Tax=Dickeya undicola TaxID=1577887 RepID=A0ABX9WRZ0_9GAMM|nr:VfmB protein [Dickeya undicola]RNM20621.1 VfmB protein [Dickeya undicola]
MSVERVKQVWDAFREQPLSDALACLLQASAGAAQYVHPIGYQIQEISNQPDVDQPQRLFDRVLNHLGLDVVRGTDTLALPASFPILVCAARLGVLARIQSMSWQHLSSRNSFGTKTTRHQLIKASFADVAGKAALLLEQQYQRLQDGDLAGLEDDHYQITQLNNEAEKMMGGHGFLLGNTHSLSYFSMMLYSVYGKASCLAAA